MYDFVVSALNDRTGEGKDFKRRRGEPERFELGLRRVTTAKAAAIFSFAETGL